MAKIPKVNIEQMCRLVSEGVLEVGDEFLVTNKDHSGELSTRREVVFEVLNQVGIAGTIHRSINLPVEGNPPTKIKDPFVIIDERTYHGFAKGYIPGKKRHEGDEEYHKLLKKISPSEEDIARGRVMETVLDLSISDPENYHQPNQILERVADSLPESFRNEEGIRVLLEPASALGYFETEEEHEPDFGKKPYQMTSRGGYRARSDFRDRIRQCSHNLKSKGSPRTRGEQ